MFGKVIPSGRLMVSEGVGWELYEFIGIGLRHSESIDSANEGFAFSGSVF